MSKKSPLEDVLGSWDLLDEDELRDTLATITLAASMQTDAEDTLRSCFKTGPLFDGDLPSKAGRDWLLNIGAVAKVCVKGESGYNACTYYGHELLRTFEALAIMRQPAHLRGTT